MIVLIEVELFPCCQVPDIYRKTVTLAHVLFLGCCMHAIAYHQKLCACGIIRTGADMQHLIRP